MSKRCKFEREVREHGMTKLKPCPFCGGTDGWIPVGKGRPKRTDFVIDVILEYTHPNDPMWLGPPRTERIRESDITWVDAEEYGGERKRRWKITHWRAIVLPKEVK